MGMSSRTWGHMLSDMGTSSGTWGRIKPNHNYNRWVTE